MASLQHLAERKGVSIAIDQALKYINKNPEARNEQIVKLSDLIKRLTGDMFSDDNLKSVKDIFTDPENKWSQYVDRLISSLHPNVLKTTLLNLGYESFFSGTKQIRKNREKYDCNIPWLILMDPTSACNLHCVGCWASEYDHKLGLSYDTMDSVIRQGKDLGVYFYLFTGGEPLVRKKDIILLAEKHNDCAFHIFTNGTLIDEQFCKDMQRLGNISVAMSLEGFEEVNDGRRGEGVYEKVMNAMELLKKYGLLFGISVCYTRANIDTVTSDEFIDMIIDKGCAYAWFFHYMPVGCDADVSLIPTIEQREYMLNRVRQLRHEKMMFAMDFQNDGEFVGGCIAGGRNYCHINPNGDVEPCVFIHYSGANINEVSLLEALNQPLFQQYRNHQPFNRNLLRPCPMLENPEMLQEMVKASGAHSTDMQEPESAEDLCAKCVNYAREWAPRADEIWYSKEHKEHSYENFKNWKPKDDASESYSNEASLPEEMREKEAERAKKLAGTE